MQFDSIVTDNNAVDNCHDFSITRILRGYNQVPDTYYAAPNSQFGVTVSFPYKFMFTLTRHVAWGVVIGIRAVTSNGCEVTVQLDRRRKNKHHCHIFVRIPGAVQSGALTCLFHTMENLFPSVPERQHTSWPEPIHPALTHHYLHPKQNQNTPYLLITVTPISKPLMPHVTPGVWSLIQTPVKLSLGSYVTCIEIGDVFPFTAGFIQAVRAVEQDWVELCIQIHPRLCQVPEDMFLYLAIPITHLQLPDELYLHQSHCYFPTSNTYRLYAQLPFVSPLP